jgi:hypothetical protein
MPTTRWMVFFRSIRRGKVSTLGPLGIADSQPLRREFGSVLECRSRTCVLHLVHIRWCALSTQLSIVCSLFTHATSLYCPCPHVPDYNCYCYPNAGTRFPSICHLRTPLWYLAHQRVYKKPCAFSMMTSPRSAFLFCLLNVRLRMARTKIEPMFNASVTHNPVL